MGLGLDSFLDLTPFEWIGIKVKHYEYQTREDQKRWEMARWQVFRTVCPPTSKSGMLSVIDFIEFPWEQNSSDSPMWLSKEKEKDEARFNALAEKWK